MNNNYEIQERRNGLVNIYLKNSNKIQGQYSKYEKKWLISGDLNETLKKNIVEEMINK